MRFFLTIGHIDPQRPCGLPRPLEAGRGAGVHNPEALSGRFAGQSYPFQNDGCSKPNRPMILVYLPCENYISPSDDLNTKLIKWAYCSVSLFTFFCRHKSHVPTISNNNKIEIPMTGDIRT